MQTGSLFVGPKLDTDWRHKTANGLTWRLAVAEDMAPICELWQKMDRTLGRQDKPDLFNMPVVLTLVAEDESGEVVAAVYGEAVIDFTGIGTNREAMESAHELFPTLRDYFFERSVRVVRVLVPRRLAVGMKKMLPGFIEITQRFAQFAYTIRL